MYYNLMQQHRGFRASARRQPLMLAFFWELHAKVTEQLSASPVGQGELFGIEVLDFGGLKNGPCEILAVSQFENHQAGPGKGQPADRPSKMSGRTRSADAHPVLIDPISPSTSRLSC